jgi:signal transduction histidine kinase
MVTLTRFAVLTLFALAGSLAHAGAVQKPSIELTPQERSYIEQNPRISMCVDPDWVPFERINPQGKHEGIAADLVQLVAQRVGLKIDLYPVKSWEESLDASKGKRCQIMSFLNQTPARDQWLIFTGPIFFDQNIIITREEHPYVGDPKTLVDQTIALPRGTMIEERIRNEYPNLQVIVTETEQEAIALVSERKADMTIRSLIVAAYTIKKEGLFNLKISGQLPAFANALRIGVLKDEIVLRDILDKGAQTLTEREREAVSNKHAAVNIQHDVDYGLVVKVLIGAALVVLAVIFWYRKLREVDRAQRLLAEQRGDQELRARREQSRLVAMLSHEMRTPVAMIDAAARSLKLLVGSEDDASKLRIERIHQGVDRMVRLTDQFLAKDRLDDEALTLKAVLIDGRELCQQLVDHLGTPSRIQLEVSGDTSLCADPEFLQVALHNLLVNALRYSPPETPVTLMCKGEAERVIFIVSDEGPGIDLEEQEHVFASYVRGSKGKDTTGAGLGLYLVKRVVDLHGGTVTLLSHPGQGAKFCIDLPRVQSPLLPVK